MTHQISVACLWYRHDECTGRTNPEYIGGIGPCRCIHHEPVHWEGDAPTSLHGNGAASFELTARDAAEVTCSLCLTLLDRESNDLPPTEAASHLERAADAPTRVHTDGSL